VTLSKRAIAEIAELRGQFNWLSEDDGHTDVVRQPDGATWWWTFAGTAGNVELGSMLGVLAPATPTSGLAIRLADDTAHPDVVERLRTEDEPVQALPADLAEAYKFADTLPEDAAAAMLEARDRDPDAVHAVRNRGVREVRLADRGPRP